MHNLLDFPCWEQFVIVHVVQALELSLSLWERSLSSGRGDYCYVCNTSPYQVESVQSETPMPRMEIEACV